MAGIGMECYCRLACISVGSVQRWTRRVLVNLRWPRSWPVCTESLAQIPPGVAAAPAGAGGPVVPLIPFLHRLPNRRASTSRSL